MSPHITNLAHIINLTQFESVHDWVGFKFFKQIADFGQQLLVLGQRRRLDGLLLLGFNNPAQKLDNENVKSQAR